MRWLHRCAVAVAVCAIASSAGILLGFVGEPQIEAAVEFCVITLAAILVSTFAIPQSAAEDEAAMPPSFVFMFAALLLFGRDAATLVAAAAAVASGLVRWRLAHPLRRLRKLSIRVVRRSQPRQHSRRFRIRRRTLPENFHRRHARTMQ